MFPGHHHLKCTHHFRQCQHTGFSFRLFILHALGNAFGTPTTATDLNNVHPREVWFFLWCTCKRLPSLVGDVYDSLAFPSLSTFRVRAIETFPAPPQLLCTRSEVPHHPSHYLSPCLFSHSHFLVASSPSFLTGPKPIAYISPHISLRLYWDKMIIVLISEQLTARIGSD